MMLLITQKVHKNFKNSSMLGLLLHYLFISPTPDSLPQTLSMLLLVCLTNTHLSWLVSLISFKLNFDIRKQIWRRTDVLWVWVSQLISVLWDDQGRVNFYLRLLCHGLSNNWWLHDFPTNIYIVKGGYLWVHITGHDLIVLHLK